MFNRDREPLKVLTQPFDYFFVALLCPWPSRSRHVLCCSYADVRQSGHERICLAQIDAKSVAGAGFTIEYDP